MDELAAAAAIPGMPMEIDREDGDALAYRPVTQENHSGVDVPDGVVPGQDAGDPSK